MHKHNLIFTKKHSMAGYPFISLAQTQISTSVDKVKSTLL